MGKHPLDHDHGSSKSRLEKFTEAEKSGKPSGATKDLQTRPRKDSGARMEKFAKIERGKGEV